MTSSDPDGRPVTDAATIARCQKGWTELHRRTAGNSAIQRGRIFGGD